MFNFMKKKKSTISEMIQELNDRISVIDGRNKEIRDIGIKFIEYVNGEITKMDIERIRDVMKAKHLRYILLYGKYGSGSSGKEPYDIYCSIKMQEKPCLCFNYHNEDKDMEYNQLLLGSIIFFVDNIERVLRMQLKEFDEAKGKDAIIRKINNLMKE